jgi:putative acetyltransferase
LPTQRCARKPHDLLIDLRIRPETPADRDEITRVTAAAFGKQFEARMVDAIRASDGFVPELSLVAEAGGRIVGHLMLSYVGLEGQSRRLLELAPMSVHPDWQRRGVGSALVQEALRIAGERREPLVLVLGHPTYYPRFGFRPASEIGIVPPGDVPDDVFMAVALQAYEPEIRGRIVFPPAFAGE